MKKDEDPEGPRNQQRSSKGNLYIVSVPNDEYKGI
jgi:hypothetical protein